MLCDSCYRNFLSPYGGDFAHPTDCLGLIRWRMGGTMKNCDAGIRAPGLPSCKHSLILAMLNNRASKKLLSAEKQAAIVRVSAVLFSTGDILPFWLYIRLINSPLGGWPFPFERRFLRRAL